MVVVVGLVENPEVTQTTGDVGQHLHRTTAGAAGAAAAAGLATVGVAETTIVVDEVGLTVKNGVVLHHRGQTNRTAGGEDRRMDQQVSLTIVVDVVAIVAAVDTIEAVIVVVVVVVDSIVAVIVEETGEVDLHLEPTKVGTVGAEARHSQNGRPDQNGRSTPEVAVKNEATEEEATVEAIEEEADGDVAVILVVAAAAVAGALGIEARHCQSVRHDQNVRNELDQRFNWHHGRQTQPLVTPATPVPCLAVQHLWTLPRRWRQQKRRLATESLQTRNLQSKKQKPKRKLPEEAQEGRVLQNQHKKKRLQRQPTRLPALRLRATNRKRSASTNSHCITAKMKHIAESILSSAWYTHARRISRLGKLRAREEEE